MEFYYKMKTLVWAFIIFLGLAYAHVFDGLPAAFEKAYGDGTQREIRIDTPTVQHACKLSEPG